MDKNSGKPSSQSLSKPIRTGLKKRAYELIYADRDGELTEEERKELESYLVIEHLMELIKLEAHRQLRQQAS